MKARITRHTYNDEIKTEHGEFKIDNNNNIYLTIDSLNLTMIGNGTKKIDVNFTLRQAGSDSYIEFNIHWRDPWTLIGEWKSRRGDWEKITISIKELKKKRLKDWWDHDEFADKVELTLVAYDPDNQLILESPVLYNDKYYKINDNQRKLLMDIGPRFVPYHPELDIEKLDKAFHPITPTSGERVVGGFKWKKIQQPIGNVSISKFADQGMRIRNLPNIGKVEDIKNYNVGSTSIITDIHFIREKHQGNSISYYNNKKKLSGDFKPYSLYCNGIFEDGSIALKRVELDVSFKKKILSIRWPKSLNGMSIDPTICKSEQEFNILTHHHHDVSSSFMILANIFAHKPANNMWRVIAKEDQSKVTFDVAEDQIHSLLYAQSIWKDRNRSPLTQSGKFAPIKHYVKSHQKRMRNGTSITVPRHLRGKEDIRIGTTDFKIIHK